MQKRKINVELPYINKNLKWKIGVSITGDPIKYGPNSGEVYQSVSMFDYGDTSYVKVSPKPNITFDIKNPKQETTGSFYDNSIFIPGSMSFQFIQCLKRVLDGFQTKNLFYYTSDGKLCVNKTISSNLIYEFALPGKKLRFIYGVVNDTETADASVGTDYEGVALVINEFVNYVYITYDELGTMYGTLKNLDLTNLALNAMIISALIPKGRPSS